MKKILFIILILLVCFYLLVCALLFFFQEKLIFFPQKLDKNHQFDFSQPFEELNIQTSDGTFLHGLLFKADSSKGLIFYLHGNAGSLHSWGKVAQTYTDFEYDVFILDYRGYGKSEGHISGQNQLFGDNQAAYNELKKRYSEDQIIVLGYSIGTGLAAHLASVNHPKLLMLQAPYYSLTDLMKHTYPFLPTFLLRYKLNTNEYLQNCQMPVVLFHGDQDRVIYPGSSLKLKAAFKAQDTLILLNGQGHNGMTDNEAYKTALAKILQYY